MVSARAASPARARFRAATLTISLDWLISSAADTSFLAPAASPVSAKMLARPRSCSRPVLFSPEVLAFRAAVKKCPSFLDMSHVGFRLMLHFLLRKLLAAHGEFFGKKIELTGHHRRVVLNKSQLIR